MPAPRCWPWSLSAFQDVLPDSHLSRFEKQHLSADLANSLCEETGDCVIRLRNAGSRGRAGRDLSVFMFTHGWKEAGRKRTVKDKREGAASGAKLWKVKG